MSKRNLIEEIIGKKERLAEKGTRLDHFMKRISPVVSGFRAVNKLDSTNDYKDEWLKYGAIGYVACIEGYVRLLIADLIDAGEPYLTNVCKFKDIKFSIENIIAIHSGKVTLGDYISHLIPINSTYDINYHLSVILDIDLFNEIANKPVSELRNDPVKNVFPHMFERVQQLFELRHLYAHELATNEKVNARTIEECISASAFIITYTEEIITEKFLK